MKLSTAFVPLCLVLPLSSHAVKIQTYAYEFECDGLRKPLTMTVESDDRKTVVTYHNEFDDKEIATYDADRRLLLAVYVDPQGRETGRAVYDYSRRLILVSGLAQARYRLSEPSLDNNGSLFFFFSHFYPAPPESEKFFYLVQSNVSHITDPVQRFLLAQLVGPVEMSLRAQGEEDVALAGGTRRGLRYELGIHDSRLAAFWPTKYHFWYSADRRMLLQYQGLNADRKLGVVRFVSYSERDYPNPELPAL